MQPNITGVNVSDNQISGNLTISHVHVTVQNIAVNMYDRLAEEGTDTIAFQQADLSPELVKRIERAMLVAPVGEYEDDFAKQLDSLLRQAIHSLAIDAFDEDSPHQLFNDTFGANSFVKTIFVGLDILDLPLPVKYGVAKQVDYDYMRAQLCAWFVSSFDRDRAAKHFEEEALTLVDVKSTVAALIEFVHMKRAGLDSRIDVDVLKAELNQVVAPYLDEEGLRSSFGHGIAVGLPEKQLFVEQLVDASRNAIISASEKL